MPSPTLVRSHRLRFLACLGIPLGLALTPAAVEAFPSSRLVYSRGRGAEQCPDEETVRREVAARLGYDPFFPWAERTIVARITREGGTLRASVDLLDKDGFVRGSRQLKPAAADCAELVRSLALAISIAIDPEHADPSANPAPAPTETAPAPSAEPVPSPTPPEAKPAPPSKPPAVPPSSNRRIVPEAGIGVWSALGLAPEVTFGGKLYAGATWGALGVFLEGLADLPVSRDGVSVAIVAGSLVPCFEQDVWFACALGSWGRLRAAGVETKTGPYVAVGGRLGARVPLWKQLVLRATVDTLVPLDHTEVKAGELNRVWELPLVAGALGFDIGVRF
jgi:hypothetical protein